MGTAGHGKRATRRLLAQEGTGGLPEARAALGSTGESATMISVDVHPLLQNTRPGGRVHARNPAVPNAALCEKFSTDHAWARTCAECSGGTLGVVATQCSACAVMLHHSRLFPGGLGATALDELSESDSSSAVSADNDVS